MRLKKTWNSKTAEMVKATSLLGTSAADIITLLKRLDYEVPSIVTFRKLYKKELAYRDEFLIALAHHAYKRAKVSDKILQFVLQTQLPAFRITNNQEITMDSLPQIKLVFENDDSAERNKLK